MVIKRLKRKFSSLKKLSLCFSNTLECSQRSRLEPQFVIALLQFQAGTLMIRDL